MIERTVVDTKVPWLEQRSISAVIGVGAFVVMTALGAHVRIPLPFTPVPITLQTFFVSLAGATLGPALGPLSQSIYLVAGAIGFPIFAGGEGGLAYLLRGATSGYLIGFVAASTLVGWLIRRRENPGILWTLGSLAAGSLAIYVCGVTWLAWSLRLSLGSAIAKGVLPFLLGDVLKICSATGLFRSYRCRARTVIR